MARSAVAAALVLAVVLIGLIVLSGGSSYRLRLLFTDAGGLVHGDPVMIGPAQIGSVQSVTLAQNGAAAVEVGLSSEAALVRQGTVARIEENGLAGIASHYITLQPSAGGAPIPSGGTIGEVDTHAEVDLDELFDTFNSSTRSGLSHLIQGEAASITGRASQARSTLEYLDPALASTASVTAELDRYEPAFDQLLVTGSQTMETLAARSEQLTQLVSSTASATGAIASESRPLDTALGALPNALNDSTATFSGLRQTLSALTPVVNVARPAVRQFPELAAALRKLVTVGAPAVTDLATLLGRSGLAGVFEQAPGLARTAVAAFPRVIASLNASQTQIDSLRAYTPDIVAALADLGQASGYYDANGHYTRVEPWFGAFTIDSRGALEPNADANRYQGLSFVHGRCPGSAVPPSADGSTPVVVTGCTLSSTMPGS